MCGRDTFFATWDEVRAFSEPMVTVTPKAEPVPTWNRAPTADGFVLIPADALPDGHAVDRSGGQSHFSDGEPKTADSLSPKSESDPRCLRAPGDPSNPLVAWPARWGLVPAWSKSAKGPYATHNARIETAASKPTFRNAWKHRRCLVPSSGYFEWRDEGGQKQPWFIHASDDGLLMFAGLWERWHSPDGSPLDSYTIVTKAADGPLAVLHDRRPIALPPALFGEWLTADADAAIELLLANPGVPLKWHPVARAVGRPQINEASNIDPIKLDTLPLNEVHHHPARPT